MNCKRCKFEWICPKHVKEEHKNEEMTRYNEGYYKTEYKESKCEQMRKMTAEMRLRGL